MTTDRIRHEEGAPFPLTVLAIPPEEWERAVSRLPLGSRFGGRFIGYVADASASHPQNCIDLVGEVWTPTEEIARIVSQRYPVPVRVVPPAVRPPVESERELVIDLDAERFWFLAVDGGRGVEDSRAASAAIECVRRLVRSGDSGVGLCLFVGPEKSGLALELSHLPVRVVVRPLDTESLNTLITACDGYLDLYRAPRIDPGSVRATMLGEPVVTGWEVGDGGGEDFTDLGVAFQRVAEIAAYPETGQRLASTLKTEVVKEYAPQTVSRTWRQRICDVLAEDGRKDGLTEGDAGSVGGGCAKD
jgi:hypothetical protein